MAPRVDFAPLCLRLFLKGAAACKGTGRRQTKTADCDIRSHKVSGDPLQECLAPHALTLQITSGIWGAAQSFAAVDRQSGK
jgi:hypothetical protein